MTQQTLDLVVAPSECPTAPETLQARYREACARCFDPGKARRRLSEYDQFRAAFWHALYDWDYGSNKYRANTLSELAWAVLHEINEGGTRTHCLNWSDTRQKLFLGDGLVHYLGLLRDDLRSLYEPKS